MNSPSNAPQSSAPDVDSTGGVTPRHVAIIMDGNNRWAKREGLGGVEGHRKGAKRVRELVENSARAGIEVLTVYAFSSENWRRPEDEVSGLMNLFLEALAKEVPDLHENEIKLKFIGDLSAFSAELRAGMNEAMALTANNKRMTFAVAVNYGGHWDITNACRQLATQVAAGELRADAITSDMLQQQVALGELPLPDLLIRTGGEQRVSNFLLWQLAYAEFYFSPVLWPDFDQQELANALAEYSGRQRRFGRTSAQIEAGSQ